ncbi:MAG: glycosyltransferase, partial [Deltaproteobacteria bacterium]|nr:glycosyltransferase [Deltaproteobacteria bacterium]
MFAKKNTEGQTFSAIVQEDAKKLMGDIFYLDDLKKETSKLSFFSYLILHVLCHPVRVIQFILLFDLNHFHKFHRLLQAMYYVRKVRELDVDHVHAHFALDACSTAMFVSILTGISYSFTIHAFDIFTPNKAKFMENKLKTAKFIVSISDFNKAYIINKYPSVDEKKIEIVHCGIDPDVFIPVTKVRNKIFKILSVGRLVDKKGYQYLIEACHILKRKRINNFTCSIIGEGSEREELEKTIDKLGLIDIVHLEGAKN